MERSVPNGGELSLTLADDTSPSQLQEITLDQDTFTNSMSLRSPGGPMRGRSVKEFEEQLSNLKKENFTLKLRIYFLEDRMGVNFNLDKENIVKKNVELMVEVENLRKEIQEKQDLLCEAVMAMDVEDELHKKVLTEREQQLNDCQQEIENLKVQLLDVKAENELMSPKSSEFASSQDSCNALRDLQERIKSLEEELDQERQNGAAVQLVFDQNDAKVKSLTAQLEEANRKLASRDDEKHEANFQLNEARTKCQGLYKKLQEKNQTLDELSSENEELRKRNAQMASEISKERKRYERLRASSEHQLSDLQAKLQTSQAELKKGQELVVSKSPGRRPSGITDADSFSVQEPPTTPGSPQKDTLSLPAITSSPVTSPLPSPTVFNEPDGVDLMHVIEQLKTDREHQNKNIVKLKAEQIKACKIIKSMIESRNKTEAEISLLKRRNEELERQLEGLRVKARKSAGGSDVSSSSGSQNENSMDEQDTDLLEHYKALIDELEEKNRIIEATLHEKGNQIKRLLDDYEKMRKSNKEKEERINDLEFEALAAAQVDEADGEKSNECYVKQLKQKEMEIELLNSKLQKKNCDLQGLVNNELWEKNREIEKLQKKQASKLLENKDSEIEKLQFDLTSKEQQLKVIKEKISEFGIDIAIQDDGISVEKTCRDELEKSEKLRLEANEVCIVLSRRLEELAVFLDSLLRQKSVLGFLGCKENKRLRQIIDQSLDFSRTFTMSMLINPDQSLLQLSSISTLLNDTGDCSASRFSIVPGNISLNYRSHLSQNDDQDQEDSAQIIQTLREQIVNLKCELQLRDVELGRINLANTTEPSSEKDGDLNRSALNTTSTTLKYKSDNQSESEAWSEPDRAVSRARIGLETSVRTSPSKKTVSNTSTDSTEEESANRSARSSLGKKGIFNESRNTILELHNQVCELDQRLNEKEVAYCEATKTNKKLRQELTNFEIKLEETEARLRDAEDKKLAAGARIEELVKELSVKDCDVQKKVEEAWSAAKEAEIAKSEKQAVENRLQSMQKEMNQFEDNLRVDYEHQLVERLQILEEESLKKINQVQGDAEIEIKSLHNRIQQLQDDYGRNYVKKCELEEAHAQVERLRAEVAGLEECIGEMKDEEQRTKKKLVENEEKINLLRGDLDNATLQYSEAVLEKTKIANEKAVLESDLARNILKDVDMKKRLDEVESELQILRQTHHKQVSLLQTHKSQLEVRISELESSNAELHNRLIKIQAGCGGDHVSQSSSSLPNTPNFVNQIVSFRRQHSDNGGYLSEEHLGVEANRSFHRLIPNQNFEIERNEANSSPDLGIESDHGRFSSLETHVNLHRPLLQTLELTESMSNLLDLEINQGDTNCGNANCCQKMVEMAHEIRDLKRELLRKRRALEETVTQLALANQRKKQVEKKICRQIHKTSQVLRKAKANLDSGSETDVYKK